MPGLLDRFIYRNSRDGPCPNLEFTTFHDTAARCRRDLKNDPPGGGRRNQLLAARNSGGPAQLTRKNDSVRRVEFNLRFHAISMAWLWRDASVNKKGGSPGAAIEFKLLYYRCTASSFSIILRSFERAMFWIWRTRSRVTPNFWPTSSSVFSDPPSRPKR